MEQQPEKYLVLYDGICNLCNASVGFIRRNDTSKKFQFAPLASDFAHETLLRYRSKLVFDSLVFLENDHLYTESTAILKIARHLRFYKFFYFLIIIPKWIRDPFYRLLAKNRYRLFGMKEQCPIDKQ
jgi:predicted DCC family thiol-disulfide oxidoreductase YuxK